jgi:hypothetical protein
LGEGLIDCCEKLSLRVGDLDEGRTLTVRSHDEDGRGLRDAGLNAELAVGLDCSRQFALRIDREWEPDSVGGGEVLRELLELVAGFDGDLIGEDLVAIVVADGLAFGVEEAGVDGGDWAPDVARYEEVVADPGDSVFGCGLHEHRIGGGAGWALEVIKFDDCHTRSGGRMEGGTIEDLHWLPLRAGSGREEQKRGKDQEKAVVETVIRSETSKQSMTHNGWAIHESYFRALPEYA